MITVARYVYTSEQRVELSTAGLEQCFEKLAVRLAKAQVRFAVK
jgi:hypothetical protein